MGRKKGKKINREECIRFKEYYIKQHPDWSIEKCENEAKKVRKRSNCLNIEYYEYKYPELSHDDHLKLLEEKKQELRKNKPTTIEYYKYHYPDLSYEEQLKLMNEYVRSECYCCVEYYAKRYPNLSYEEHIKMRDDAKQQMVNKLPDVSGKNNPNHKSNTTLEQRQERSPFSKKFYEKRNLTEEDRYNFTNNIKREYSTQISYYIHKGYSEEESKEMVKERQRTFTKEKCIQKYGEIEGIKRFNERQEKWKKKLQEHFYKNGDGRSPQSNIAKEIISAICEYFNVEIPKTEKYLYNKIKQCAYAYDFCFKHKILEVNGDYWHCNPKIYDANYFNKNKGLSARDIWIADAEKLKCANEYGYETLVIWESDYKEDKYKEINKCIDFFNR